MRNKKWEEEVLFSATPHYPIKKGYVLNNIISNYIMLSDLSKVLLLKILKKYVYKIYIK